MRKIGGYEIILCIMFTLFSCGPNDNSDGKPCPELLKLRINKFVTKKATLNIVGASYAADKKLREQKKLRTMCKNILDFRHEFEGCRLSTQSTFNSREINSTCDQLGRELAL